jgi:Kazal-type serine protease inhibitor domain
MPAMPDQREFPLIMEENVYTPMCGCDGVTYGNVCVTASAGVSIDYERK